MPADSSIVALKEMLDLSVARQKCAVRAQVLYASFVVLARPQNEAARQQHPAVPRPAFERGRFGMSYSATVLGTFLECWDNARHEQYARGLAPGPLSNEGAERGRRIATRRRKGCRQ